MPTYTPPTPGGSSVGMSSLQSLSRDQLINIFFESDLATILGPSIAYIPEGGIPEGQKMRIESKLTGVPPVEFDWTYDDVNTPWGFFEITSGWGYTSKIQNYRSSLESEISEGEKLGLGEMDEEELYYEMVDESGASYYVRAGSISGGTPMTIPVGDAIYLPSYFAPGTFTMFGITPSSTTAPVEGPDTTGMTSTAPWAGSSAGGSEEYDWLHSSATSWVNYVSFVGGDDDPMPPGQFFIRIFRRVQTNHRVNKLV